MKENINIEELFKEQFSSFEGNVSPDAWANIQQGMNAAGIGGSAVAAKTGMSVLLKTVLISGGIIAATVAGVYLLPENDKPEDINESIVEINNVIAETTEDSLVYKEVNSSIIAELEKNSDVENENDLLEEKINQLDNTQITSYDFSSNGTGTGSNINTATIDDITNTTSDSDDGTKTNETENIVDSSIDDETGEIIDPIVEVVAPTGKLSFKKGNRFAPTTYDFYSNAADFSRVVWDFGNGLVKEGESVRFLFEKAGKYEITMTIIGEENSYVEKQTIVIESQSRIDKIPNIITPDGDRINDFFVINSTELESFYIIIKNDKGITLFENKDPKFRWYGTDLGGNTVENGRYSYYIYAKGFDGKEYKIPGIITVE